MLTPLLLQCNHSNIVEQGKKSEPTRITSAILTEPYDGERRFLRLRLNTNDESIHPSRIVVRYTTDGRINYAFKSRVERDRDNDDFKAVIERFQDDVLLSPPKKDSLGELTFWYSEHAQRVVTLPLEGDKGTLLVDGVELEYEIGQIAVDAMPNYGLFIKQTDATHDMQLKLFDKKGKPMYGYLRSWEEGTSLSMTIDHMIFRRLKKEIGSVQIHYFPKPLKSVSLPVVDIQLPKKKD